MSRLKDYYQLTKPGIIRGNLLTAAAGFFVASRRHVDLKLLLFALEGTALIIGSACIFNNYLDRGLDEKMERTARRGLVTGTVSVRGAMLYGAVLGLSGLYLLVSYVNLLTAAVGLAGFAAYVGLYSYAKRRSHHGTLVGTISGSMPPVAGYTAVSGHLDATAAGLFLLMLCWQMAHFYSIAMYRAKDYAAAGLPVLPLVKGGARAKLEIRLYIVAFALAALFLTAVSRLGLVFAIAMAAIAAWWFYKGAKPAADKLWGKRMFLSSLIVVMVMSLLLAVGPLLP